MNEFSYNEGDIFGVPLRNGNFALGVIARLAPPGVVLLGYFYSYQSQDLPSADELPILKPQDAVAVLRFSALSLRTGEWRVISRIEQWLTKRGQWRMPRFLRRFPVSDVAWLVSYAEDDPSQEVALNPCNDGTLGYEPDGMCGAGFVEIRLTKLLENSIASN